MKRYLLCFLPLLLACCCTPKQADSFSISIPSKEEELTVELSPDMSYKMRQFAEAMEEEINSGVLITATSSGYFMKFMPPMCRFLLNNQDYYWLGNSELCRIDESGYFRYSLPDEFDRDGKMISKYPLFKSYMQPRHFLSPCDIGKPGQLEKEIYAWLIDSAK